MGIFNNLVDKKIKKWKKNYDNIYSSYLLILGYLLYLYLPNIQYYSYYLFLLPGIFTGNIIKGKNINIKLNPSNINKISVLIGDLK